MGATTREEKAALLLKSLPPEFAESVLTQFGPEHGERLRAQIQRLTEAGPSAEELNRVHGEFAAFVQGAASVAAQHEGGPGARQGEQEPEPPLPEPGSVHDAVAALRELPHEKLIQALRGESLHTLSLVLNCLEPNRAGDLMKLLPAELRKEASLRLGKPLPANPELLQTVARAVLRKCQALSANPEANSADAKVRRYADILRRLERADRIEVLTVLEQNEPETAAKLKELLYRFDDLAFIEDRSMQRLLSEFDSKSLATALKGASDAVRDKVMKNLSRRAREALAEEMEFLGNVPSAQLQQAQKVIVEGMQRLDQGGELVMLEQ